MITLQELQDEKQSLEAQLNYARATEATATEAVILRKITIIELAIDGLKFSK